MTKKTPRPKKSDFIEYEVWVTLSDKALERTIHGGMLASGVRIFETSTFTGGNLYRTVGLTYEIFSSNDRVLCWMVFDDNSVLQIKSVSEFRLPTDEEVYEIYIRNDEFTNEQKIERVDGKPVPITELLGKKLLSIGEEQITPDGIFKIFIIGEDKNFIKKRVFKEGDELVPGVKVNSVKIK